MGYIKEPVRNCPSGIVQAVIGSDVDMAVEVMYWALDANVVVKQHSNNIRSTRKVCINMAPLSPSAAVGCDLLILCPTGAKVTKEVPRAGASVITHAFLC